MKISLNSPRGVIEDKFPSQRQFVMLMRLNTLLLVANLHANFSKRNIFRNQNVYGTYSSKIIKKKITNMQIGGIFLGIFVVLCCFPKLALGVPF